MIPKMHMPVLRVLLVCVSSLACGCASVDFLKFGKPDFPTADAKNPVVQVLALWQPANGVGLDGKSCRGFAGQILFLTRENPVPAKVDGKVDIYTFDDQGNTEEMSKPLHHFIFEGDGWNTQARISKLGLTYAVFIPYTRAGAHEAHCSLRVGFTPKDGHAHTVYSEMCNVDLAGISRKKAVKDTDAQDDEAAVDDEYVRKALKAAHETTTNGVQQASYSEPAGARNNRQAIEQIAAEAFRDANANASTAPRKLDPAEEQRIIREMQAQMGGLPATTGGSQKPQLPPARARGRNPLEEDAAASDDADEAPVYHRTAHRPPTRHGHILDDASEADDADLAASLDDDAPSRAPRKGKEKKAGRPGRHPLEADEIPETTGTKRKRRDALTINLSELR